MTHYALGIIDKPSGTPSFPFPVIWDYNPETGGALPTGFTFTRGGSGWYRNGSGVWLERTTNQIIDSNNATPGGGEVGFLNEPARTKINVETRNLAAAAWAKSNTTAARNDTGLNGAASEASTVTATANNGTILQTVTSGSGDHTFQPFVARNSGTGTVEMTIDGSTWVDITSSLTSAIDNPFRVSANLANPQIGFRLGTNGDQIRVDCAELEAVSNAISPIVDNSTGTLTRVADRLKYSTITDTAYSVYIDLTYPYELGPDGQFPALWHWDGSADRMQTFDDGFSVFRRVQIGGAQMNISTSTGTADGLREKIAFRIDANDCALSVTGQTQVTSGTMGTKTGDINLGNYTSINNSRATIHRAALIFPAISDAELETLVGN